MSLPVVQSSQAQPLPAPVCSQSTLDNPRAGCQSSKSCLAGNQVCSATKPHIPKVYSHESRTNVPVDRFNSAVRQAGGGDGQQHTPSFGNHRGRSLDRC